MATQWTLLNIVQEFCRRQNLVKPANVVTSQDETVLQAWGLLNEEVIELRDRADWKERHLQIQFVHANRPGYLAYDLSQAGGNSLLGTPRYVVRDTMWDVLGGLMVAGPLTDQEWQAMLVQRVSGGVYNWRMSNLGVCIYPVPTAGITPHYFSFEAVVREVVKGPLAGSQSIVYKDIFDDDNDVPLLPGEILVAGLRWRYRAEKGLPYAELKATYELLIAQAATVDQGNPVASMCYDPLFPQVPVPGTVLVPAGNWPVR